MMKSEFIKQLTTQIQFIRPYLENCRPAYKA
jgi:hypothetical protein